MNEPIIIDLTNHFNAKGIVWDDMECIPYFAELVPGGLAGEVLPNGEFITVDDYSFFFPVTNTIDNDHLICEGQIIQLDNNCCSHEIGFICSAILGNQMDFIEIKLNNECITKRLDVTDMSLTSPHFDEKVALKVTRAYSYNENIKEIIETDYSLWFVKIKLSEEDGRFINYIKLPDNPLIVVYSITQLSQLEISK